MTTAALPLVHIVLCGGKGVRLWPYSRDQLPKPFITLPGQQHTLIESTYARLHDDAAPAAIAVITVTSSNHAFLCEESYNKCGGDIPHIIIRESVARNTAAAIAAATIIAQQRFGDDVVLSVWPADHLIQNTTAFCLALQTAIAGANSGRLMLFGIPPTSPSTEFGYIKCGERLAPNVYNIRQFIEKPDRQTALELTREALVLWNAGMFCFQAKTGLAELSKHAADIMASLTRSCTQTQSKNHHVLLPESAYTDLPSVSFDHAVMEKTTTASVVRTDDLVWSDVGTWRSIEKTLPPDMHGNRVSGDAQLLDCENCLIVGTQRLIAGIGISNLHVIDSPDALLISDAHHSHRARELVATLADDDREETMVPTTVLKPWGTYTVLSAGEGYKVKRIEVRPGAKLSLQSHQRRSEHWTTVAGVMTVVIDDNTFTLPVGKHCHIPQETKHRMENNGDTTAAVIEIQIGDYLGEDDITRYEDLYGRTSDA